MVEQWSRNREVPGPNQVDALVPFDKALFCITRSLGRGFKAVGPMLLIQSYTWFRSIQVKRTNKMYFGNPIFVFKPMRTGDQKCDHVDVYSIDKNSTVLAFMKFDSHKSAQN